MSEPEYVYRTTNTVRCEWCGAEPGQSCRLEPGRYAGYGTTEKFHTIRVDPTSEPVGILGCAEVGYDVGGTAMSSASGNGLLTRPNRAASSESGFRD